MSRSNALDVRPSGGGVITGPRAHVLARLDSEIDLNGSSDKSNEHRPIAARPPTISV